MLWLLLYVFCIVVALGMGLLAGWTDFSGLKIPNVIPVVIAAAFFPACLSAHVAGVNVMSHWWWQLGAGAAMLILTFLLFSFRIMGGGDAKLLSAFALWTGFAGLPMLLFYMAMSGALVGLATLYLNKKKPVAAPREGSWIARAQGGENRVPYGIPIVLGALIAFSMQHYLSAATLGAFLQR